MDLLPTGEQQQIIDSAAAFLADHFPLRRLHRPDGETQTVTPALWRQAADMGWLAMTLEEDAGGIGYTVVEEALVYREMGRVLAPPRLLITAVAAKAAAACGATDLAVRLGGGQATAALAVQNDYAAPPDSRASLRLYEFADADVALFLYGDDVQILDLAGLNLQPRPSLDKSVSMAVADLSAASVISQGTAPSIRLAGALLSAAALVGLSELARDMIVEYAKIRHTFGRPIGAYQAVRHPISDMAVRSEEAKSQLLMAALAMAADRGDSDLQVSSARVLAEAAALQNADDNIQLHGGIGVTDEFDAHFLIKRANTMASWFGDRRQHLKRILDTPIASPGAA